MERASTAVETATSWVAYSRWLLSRRRPLMSRPASTAQVAAKTRLANTAARTWTGTIFPTSVLSPVRRTPPVAVVEATSDLPSSLGAS